MSNLYHIATGMAVYSASIIGIPDSGTADTDEQGYLLTDGTQRGLAAGIGTDGILYMWMTTNGDPVIIEDDLDAARNLCIDMGDAPDDEDERLQTGVQRIIDACDWLDTILTGEESAECIDWYRDKAREVLSAEGE